MMVMPARSRNTPRQPERPEPSVLRLPLSDAQNQLNARIDAGRQLVDVEATALDTELAATHFQRRMYRPGESSPGDQKVDALSRRVRQWTDYNRTWLSRNLGGEAAAEYESTSTHFNFGGADDPRVNLRWLGENVESEVSKLESILDRLSMWLPDDLVGPVAAATAPLGNGIGSSVPATNRKLVMVIYGHDDDANNALFDWLRAIGLEPQEWSQIIQATGNVSPYIGQALERAFDNAQAVVAFFTPDERVLGRDASPLDHAAWRLQARPNVLIEAGMALTSHPDRTLLVILGDQELPSDLAGRHYVRLSNTSSAPLIDLANRLSDAGCETNITGTAWVNPARFPNRSGMSAAP
jgi:predicted nucleotide-binding protein